MRKVLSLFVGICLGISLFTGVFVPVPSAAALTDGVWIYDVDGGNASISGYAGSGGAIIIPSTIGSGALPVTAIGNYAFESKQGQLLTSVTIPDSITSIGSWAFRNCSALTAVRIPDSVTSVGGAAFWGCIALTSVTIGNGVAYMGNSVLQGCTAPTTAVIGTGVTSLPYAMFSGCTKLTTVSIPTNVTSIGTNVFSGCTALTSVTMPNTISAISDHLFQKCTALTSVAIPNSVTTIGESAFSGCAALTSVAIPSSVTLIGAYAFYGCEKLTSVIIPNSVTAIGSNGFSFCSALTSLTIGSGVTTIGDHAFQSSPALTSLTIGSGVKTIGDNAFYWCPRLAEAWFLGNAPTTGTHIFLDCAAGFTVRYVGGTTGWTNPWYTYPTKVFVPQTYALTVVASGTGSVAKLPEGSSYQFGTVVALTATPAAGYVFGGWSGDVTGMTNPVVVAMDANKTATASFKALPAYTLTPSAGTGGAVVPSAEQRVFQGESRTFTVTASAGYHIVDVAVDGVSQGTISSYTFTNVTSNHTIKAIFESEQKPTVIVLQIGKSTFTVNGVSKTLDSPPVIKNGRTLVPIRAIIEALGGTIEWDGTARKATVILGGTSLGLWIGKSSATVNGTTTPIDVTNSKVVPEIINGRTMLPLRFVVESLGADVSYDQGTKSITITLTDRLVTTGTVNPSAVTRMSQSVTYAGKKYLFEIVRVDLQGKDIRVVPVASPGGMNSGAPYTTFAFGNPLAMINALPFDTTSHVMTGSLGGGGICPQVKAGYVETIGIDDHGVPFYAEGTLEVRADVTAASQTTSITTYSINSTSWGGFTVYTNWYPTAIWIGSNEQLVVVDQGRIIQRVCGATFQPKLMKTGQYAIHGYQWAENHWTIDTIALLRNAESIQVHILLDERDLSTGFFIQSAPVVLRAGQPFMGADRYADSFRMTKSGARSFLGIGGGRYLYFIASPTPMSLRTDNVGGAMAQLKLFSDVISLDGGGSTTLYYKGSYIYTPCRQLVTCLVVPQ